MFCFPVPPHGQNYIANKTPFEAAMQDVKASFGLTLPTDPDAANAGKLLLTDYEVQNLRTAYDRTLEVGSASQKDMTQQDYELYGTYIPFSMAICHTIINKLGIHARPAAQFVKLASKFDADIVVEKDGEEVDGKSILGLMMLAVGHGSKITITAEGKDEQEALNALEDLISRKFEED